MASELEIIRAIKSASSIDIKVRIIDQLGLKIKPQHRELIAYLVETSRQELDSEISYSVKKALFQIRSRYNITNFPLFLMDPVNLLQSSDPAYRLKALDIFEKKDVTLEQCYYFLGSINFEDDPFVLSKMIMVLPLLVHHLPLNKVQKILSDFLEHENSRVRANAVEVMAEVKTKMKIDYLGTLWKILNDFDQRVRANAIHQLLLENRKDMEAMLLERAKSSQDYYELISIVEIAEKIDLEFEKSLEKSLNSRISKLQKSEEEKAKKEESSHSIPLSVEKEPMGINFSLIKMIPFKWLLAFSIILFIAFYSLGKKKELKKNLVVKALKQEVVALKKESQSFQEQVKKMSIATPIHEQKIALNSKLSLLKKGGASLKESSNSFFTEAKSLYQHEKYKEAIEIYKAVYEVYKDNRLAVDSVRWLSKTQKVQNVLASVANYQRKKQYISAVKKLEEIRHLVSKENYDRHLELLKKEKKK
ncbi:HEAT repeat domain-containing protein [bacterium]|nr:HEAT repeat domain-containing protein [bacterium]